MKKSIYLIIILLFSCLFINLLQDKQSRLHGYARQVYNYINGGSNSTNINKVSISDILNVRVSGIQHSLSIKEIDLSDITKPWGVPAYSPPAYFFEFNDRFYILTNSGYIWSYSSNGHRIGSINSNFPQLLAKQKYISTDSSTGEDISGRFGVRSVGYNPKDGYVYIAYHKELKNKCYSMGIDKGLFNEKFIEFKNYYIGNFCRKNFNAHDSGGRLAFLKDQVILTIGAYDINLNSSKDDIKDLINPSLEVGAVVTINTDGKSKIISKGHRNQQGLTIANSKIFITEHGPMGGINL